MDEIEQIMQICQQALEEAGYETYGYSEAFGKFTVKADECDVTVGFDESDYD